MSTCSNIRYLPNELLLEIFKKPGLSVRDIAISQLVCRKFNDLINDDSFQLIWREAFETKFDPIRFRFHPHVNWKDKYVAYTLKEKHRSRSQDIFDAALQCKRDDPEDIDIWGILSWVKLIVSQGGTPEEKEKAFKIMKNFQDLHMDCEYFLGMMYLKGIGTEENAALARMHLSMAASHGHAKAKYEVAMIFLEELNQVAQESGLKYLKEAANKRVIEAQYFLGCLCLEGEKIEMDPFIALLCIKSAADQGYLPAQLLVAKKYEGCNDIIPDPKEAFRYYKLAADQGDAKAQEWVGEKYCKGVGTEVNRAEAFRYLKCAADQGRLEACINVGRMYDKGFGVLKNRTKAFEYYQLAADKGDIESLYVLGTMLFHGKGVELDRTNAFRYFRSAAHKGHSRAQYFVGAMYYNGLGAEKNRKRGLAYMQKSAANGYKKAQDFLNDLNRPQRVKRELPNKPDQNRRPLKK